MVSRQPVVAGLSIKALGTSCIERCFQGRVVAPALVSRRGMSSSGDRQGASWMIPLDIDVAEAMAGPCRPDPACEGADAWHPLRRYGRQREDSSELSDQSPPRSPIRFTVSTSRFWITLSRFCSATSWVVRAVATVV